MGTMCRGILLHFLLLGLASSERPHSQSEDGRRSVQVTSRHFSHGGGIKAHSAAALQLSSERSMSPPLDRSRETGGSHEQVPPGDAPRRSAALGGFSTGDNHLDHLDEDSEEDEGFNAPRRASDRSHEVEPEPNDGDPRYVPEGQEHTHLEDQMSNEEEQRYNHFQELLKLKPRVKKAIETFRQDVHATRMDAHSTGKRIEKTGEAVDQMRELLHGPVQREADGAREQSDKEVKQMAQDTVTDFGLYNKHGVFSRDKHGIFAPDAGKWSVFKDFLVNDVKKLEDNGEESSEPSRTGVQQLDAHGNVADNHIQTESHKVGSSSEEHKSTSSSVEEGENDAPKKADLEAEE